MADDNILLAALTRLASFEAFHFDSWGRDFARDPELIARRQFAKDAVAEYLGTAEAR